MKPSPSHSKTLVVAATSTALVAFAANSLLCRQALGLGGMDPAGFSCIRLVSGGAMLTLLARARTRKLRPGGEWVSAFLLCLYAFCFAFAYLDMKAGTGMLIMFGISQAVFLLGTRKPGFRLPVHVGISWTAAIVGLIWLLAPGAECPPTRGLVRIAGAGLAWGLYCVRGRAATDPVATTVGNFLRAMPLAGVACLAVGVSRDALTPSGVAFAVTSGAGTTAIGYILWYWVIQRMAPGRVGLVQFLVPLISSAGGILFQGEPLTSRLLVSAALILFGFGLTFVRWPRPRRASIPAGSRRSSTGSSGNSRRRSGRPTLRPEAVDVPTMSGEGGRVCRARKQTDRLRRFRMGVYWSRDMRRLGLGALAVLLGAWMVGCGDSPAPPMDLPAPVPEPEEVPDVPDAYLAPADEPENRPDPEEPEEAPSVSAAEVEARYDRAVALMEAGEFFEAWQAARDLRLEVPEDPRLPELVSVTARLRREGARLDMVVRNLADENPLVVETARRRIEDAGDAGRFLLRKAVREGDRALAAEAARILVGLGDHEASSFLAGRLTEDEDPDLGRTITDLLLEWIRDGHAPTLRASLPLWERDPIRFAVLLPAFAETLHGPYEGDEGAFRQAAGREDVAEQLVQAVRAASAHADAGVHAIRAAGIWADPALLREVFLAAAEEGAEFVGLPPHWRHQDIGADDPPGRTEYRDGKLSITGNGANELWGDSEDVHFAYRRLLGDGELVARILSVQDTHEYAKAGLMIRANLAPDSPHAILVANPRNRASFQFREQAGRDMNNSGWSGLVQPGWLRLVREGDRFSGHISPDGETWEEIGSREIEMEEDVLIGFVVNSRNSREPCTAVFEVDLDALIEGLAP